MGLSSGGISSPVKEMGNFAGGFYLYGGGNLRRSDIFNSNLFQS